jgi:hypothetical protein
MASIRLLDDGLALPALWQSIFPQVSDDQLNGAALPILWIAQMGRRTGKRVDGKRDGKRVRTI